MFRLFLEYCLEKADDDAFFEVTQPFFAFRVPVLGNPRFYPDDTAETERKVFDFGHSVLETERFQIEKA